jgi:glucose-1-phosphate cytidylyltransferase
MVDEPFARLGKRKQLFAQRHDGFWAPMDTLKDKQTLEALHERGTAPWQVWDQSRNGADLPVVAAL